TTLLTSFASMPPLAQAFGFWIQSDVLTLPACTKWTSSTFSVSNYHSAQKLLKLRSEFEGRWDVRGYKTSCPSSVPPSKADPWTRKQIRI
ncbi:hypothetical protein C8F01DRAFT_1160114, partial [Mycena amicta]